jgi:hypothetical protein
VGDTKVESEVVILITAGVGARAKGYSSEALGLFAAAPKELAISLRKG